MICQRCGKEAPNAPFCALCGFRQGSARNTRKRGNGQGTAYKRGKTWTAQKPGYSYVEDGKLIRRRPTKGGFKTKKDALAWAHTGEPEKEAPRLIDLWIGWSENDMLKLSANKQTAYKIARRRLEPIISRRIDSLTVDDLQTCVNAACSTYYPAHDMRVLLSHLYKRAIASNAVSNNLSQFIVMPELEETEAVPFVDSELKAFWSAYENGDTFIGYVLLLCYTGMMPAELFNCRKSMVDLTACEIRGCGAKTKARKKSSIVFPDFLRPVVEDLLDYSTGDKLLTMNRDNFYAAYYESLERCGVRRLPPYSCRHTFGTEAVKTGLHPALIQRLLRHSTAKMQEKYTHLAGAEIHDAANALSVGG